MNQPITEVRFCKDCAHFLGDARKFPECTAPIPKNLDLVHGKHTAFCDRMREANGPCGPEGKLFQPPAEREFVVAPDRPLIVYGPAGCGKTLAARFLAHHFGKKTIVDECSTSMAASLAPDSLGLTNSPQVPGAISFAEALIKAGLDLQTRLPATRATAVLPGSSPNAHC